MGELDLRDEGTMKLIGLSGVAQSGKDTVGAMLGEHGYVRRAFADGVRDALYMLNPYITQQYLSVPLQDLVNEKGWERAKQITEVRVLLQRMGTEVGRDIFGPNVWVQRVAANLPDLCVITDVRFPNEAAFVRERGLLVHIRRPGFGPINDHVSDAGIEEGPDDFVIYNDHGLHTLQLAAGLLAKFMEEKFSPVELTDSVLDRIDAVLDSGVVL